ncbi:peptide/nickel transport system permease protein [Cryobacterium flavum]|uniref:Peptide/nickel transport system permease protein n=2 Tax=Cryobacterium flavum TaxID=1424659 RepID=A0A5E9GY03_9MICO|nr:ABC transporter permease [Cryobacterium flavum]SDO09451.1 peptide/nickel transport system permease protein [Cryobacterium flavum]
MSILAAARSRTARTRRVTRMPTPALWVAAGFLLLLLLSALFPRLFTGADAVRTDIDAALLAPGPGHPFGTDQAGRDVFARVIYGSRYSLAIGFGATLIALLAGLVIGSLAGLMRRVGDGVLSRAIEIVMAFPEFLLALIVIAIIGPGEASLLIAVAIAVIPSYARVARVQTLVVKRAGYVEAARTLGVSPAVTVLRHVVPNTLGPLLVMATMGIGTAITAAAGLSFLGLGPKPPIPEWGLILSEGRNFLATAWWIAVFPGIVITATVVSTSVLGRHLQASAAGRQR